jgi:hypothetical protein
LKQELGELCAGSFARAQAVRGDVQGFDGAERSVLFRLRGL